MAVVISTVIQTLLAFFGAIISILEVKRYKQGKIAEKERVAIEKSLIASLDLIGYDRLVEVKNTVSASISRGNIVEIRKWIERCIDVNKGFIPVYKQLLKDESCFSLSYGFARYINSFRKYYFASEKILDDIRKKVEDIQAILDDYEKQDAGKTTEIMKLVSQIVNNHYYLGYSDEQNVALIMDEVNKGHMNNVSASIISGVYYKYKGVIERMGEIIDLIDELIPLIKELKMKYEA